MFDVIQWTTELDSQFSYNALNELLKDREALQRHLSSNYKLIEVNTDSDELTTREISSDDFTDDDNYLNSYIDNIERAIDIYRRQMIVLAVTYTEGIILDFMESLFVAFPIRMYDYLDSDSEQNLKGKVDLKDILSADTKDDLVTILSRRAASIEPLAENSELS